MRPRMCSQYSFSLALLTFVLDFICIFCCSSPPVFYTGCTLQVVHNPRHHLLSMFTAGLISCAQSASEDCCCDVLVAQQFSAAFLSLHGV